MPINWMLGHKPQHHICPNNPLPSWTCGLLSSYELQFALPQT